jgi:hypothetical protein
VAFGLGILPHSFIIALVVAVVRVGDDLRDFQRVDDAHRDFLPQEERKVNLALHERLIRTPALSSGGEHALVVRVVPV